MSTKFNSKRPAYVMPPWCLAPPLTPLPPIPPALLHMQAFGCIRWSLTGSYVQQMAMSARDIPKVSPTLFALDVSIGIETLRFSIAVVGGFITTAGLTAIYMGAFAASITFYAGSSYPWPTWDKHFLRDPLVGIPPDHGGSLFIWL